MGNYVNRSVVLNGDFTLPPDPDAPEKIPGWEAHKTPPPELKSDEGKAYVRLNSSAAISQLVTLPVLPVPEPTSTPDPLEDGANYRVAVRYRSSQNTAGQRPGLEIISEDVINISKVSLPPPPGGSWDTTETEGWTQSTSDYSCIFGGYNTRWTIFPQGAAFYSGLDNKKAESATGGELDVSEIRVIPLMPLLELETDKDDITLNGLACRHLVEANATPCYPLNIGGQHLLTLKAGEDSSCWGSKNIATQSDAPATFPGSPVYFQAENTDALSIVPSQPLPDDKEVQYFSQPWQLEYQGMPGPVSANIDTVFDYKNRADNQPRPVKKLPFVAGHYCVSFVESAMPGRVWGVEGEPLVLSATLVNAVAPHPRANGVNVSWYRDSEEIAKALSDQEGLAEAVWEPAAGQTVVSGRFSVPYNEAQRAVTLNVFPAPLHEQFIFELDGQACQLESLPVFDNQPHTLTLKTLNPAFTDGLLVSLTLPDGAAPGLTITPVAGAQGFTWTLTAKEAATWQPQFTFTDLPGHVISFSVTGEGELKPSFTEAELIPPYTFFGQSVTARVRLVDGKGMPLTNVPLTWNTIHKRWTDQDGYSSYEELNLSSEMSAMGVEAVLDGESLTHLFIVPSSYGIGKACIASPQDAAEADAESVHTKKLLAAGYNHKN